jgi:hypothetical protein
MARALSVDNPNQIARLYGLLNDPGSFAQMAAYVEKLGIPAGGQRAALRELRKSLTAALELIEQLDWQSDENIAAGYAQDENVFTATAQSISAPFYSQRNVDLAAMRRYASAVAFAADNLYTGGKTRLGIAIRYAKYIMEVYEEFAGKPLSGERSNKKNSGGAREFLEIGLNHITEGRLTSGEIGYVIRQAAERHRRPL